MIKGIILDVDGVIIGDKRGVNTPHPHKAVMAKLAKVGKWGGIPIVLCTARPAFGLNYIVQNAHLSNPHIADGGALLVDEKGKVYGKKAIDKQVAKSIVKTCIDNNIYVEVYTATDYYIQSNQDGSDALAHSKIMQRKQGLVDNLVSFCDNNEIIKLAFTVKDNTKIDYGNKLMQEYMSEITLIWTNHPPMLPIQWGIVTAPEISKEKAFLNITNMLNIPLQNWLGIGDTKSDWAFMQHCEYVGAMGNATDELKELVNSKSAKGYIGKSVDENGIIDILDWGLKQS